MSETTELKPCPFCGGEAELYVTKHIPDGYDYTPRCKRKDCAGRLTKKYAYYPTNAIYAWNRREASGKMCTTIFNPWYKRRDGVTE